MTSASSCQTSSSRRPLHLGRGPAQHKAGQKKQAAVTVTELCAAFQRADENAIAEELGHPLELAVALLVEMHRTKDALKLLSCLLARVVGPRHQPLFFGLARLYAKHGLNKDALVLKLPSLCSKPPDRRTWELLKSMAECTPVAVEQQLLRPVTRALLARAAPKIDRPGPNRPEPCSGRPPVVQLRRQHDVPRPLLQLRQCTERLM